MRELIEPFMGEYLVLRPGSSNGMKIPQGNYLHGTRPGGDRTAARRDPRDHLRRGLGYTRRVVQVQLQCWRRPAVLSITDEGPSRVPILWGKAALRPA
jgi:hypothetical protein